MRDRGRLLDALGASAVAAAVLAFTRSWIGHPLLLDGPGVATWLQLAVRHLDRYGRVGYWFPELWAGSPAWALAPSFHILWLIPFAEVLGADGALKFAAILAQVVAGLGAYVLARSSVKDRTASVVAGVIYGLHPIVLSHLALFGHEPGVWVMAATPWFAWSLRHALRDGRPRMIGLAGLCGGFTLIQQGEHAYAVILLGALYAAVQLVRGEDRSRGSVFVRSGAVAALAVALAAFWIFPFSQLQSSFALTPDTDVESFLRHGLAGEIAARPGIFFQRSPGHIGPVLMETDTVLETGNFYLGWVALALTAIGIALLPRRDEDGYLSGTLLAGALGIWLSTAAVPLALSKPALQGQIVGFAGIGITIGVLFGALFLRARAKRFLIPLTAVAGGLFVALPYLTPFQTLQRVVPFLDAVRWPRFYALAPLAVAIGAAVAVAAGLEHARERLRTDGVLAVATGILVVAAVALDVSPTRTLYGAPPEPGVAAAHRDAAERISGMKDHGRVAVYAYWDPVPVRTLLNEGLSLTNGWPHPVASSSVYTLAAKSWRIPGDHRLRAMGLLNTTHVVAPDDVAPPGEIVGRSGEYVIVRNGFAQPFIRGYARAAVVQDTEAADLLALALAPRGVSVVTGDRATATALGPLSVGFAPSRGDATGVRAGELDGELARARETASWYGRFMIATADLVEEHSAGAIVRATRPGLAGLSVVTFGGPRATVLTLQEVGADGRALGDVIREGRRTGLDELGFHHFEFDPIPDSEGKRYAVILSCAECLAGAAPKLASVVAPEDVEGNLVDDGRVDRRRLAAVVPLYERMPQRARPRLSWKARQTAPGSWDVEASTSEPTLLVMAEAYFPGWKATVDGRSVEVVKADGASVGVPIPAGSHDISLRFQPPSGAAAGRVVTLLAVLVTAVLLASPGRRRPRRPRPKLRDEIVERIPVGAGSGQRP